MKLWQKLKSFWSNRSDDAKSKVTTTDSTSSQVTHEYKQYQWADSVPASDWKLYSDKLFGVKVELELEDEEAKELIDFLFDCVNEKVTVFWKRHVQLARISPDAFQVLFYLSTVCTVSRIDGKLVMDMVVTEEQVDYDEYAQKMLEILTEIALDLVVQDG